MIERRNPVPHSCQAWSRQTCLWLVMTMFTKIFYCRNMENELKSYHKKTNWANFVWMQDSWLLLKFDGISWRGTLQNLHNLQMQWPVVSTLCQEMKEHRHQKAGSKETLRSRPYWKLQTVICMVTLESRSEFGLWTDTILTLGSEFLMDQTGLWWIRTSTTQKFQKICLKNKRNSWMWRILLADQRPKQNHEDENLPGLPQEQFLLGRELGPMTNQEIFVIYSWYFNAEFWSTWCEVCFSTEQNHPSFLIQKKNQSERTKGPETGPFPSRKTDCFPDLRVLPGHRSQCFCREFCRPVHHCSSKWWYSGIRFRMGRTFIFNDKIPFDDILEGLYNSETSLRNSWPYCNCLPWRFIGRKLDLIITDWRRWCKEVSSRIYELIFLKPDTVIMKETPWSRIRGQNSVNKEFLEIIGNGKPTSSVLKETIAVSAPTLIRGLKKWNNRIRLRVLSCSRMSEMRASRTQTNWLRIWTTMSRKPQRCSSKNLRWDWKRVILQADQRPKQNHEDENLPGLPKNSSYWEENLNRCRTRRIFTLRIWSIKEIDSSSSSCKSTSRKWWSNWILKKQRQSSETFLVLSSLVWRQVEEKHGRRRRKQENIPLLYWFLRSNVVLPISSRSFRTQSHWSFTPGQCVIQSNFFQYICHVGCAINLHSIISSGLIPGAQSLSKRQTVLFFLPVDLMDKNHMDPDVIDLSVPRHAQYLHKAWKRHQDAGYWVDINLVQEKRPVPRRSKHVLFMNGDTRCLPWHKSRARRIPNTFLLWKHKLQRRNNSWQNGETRCRPWRKSRARQRSSNAERGRHWLPNTWIATFCCETSSELSCSWNGQEDREPPSPTCSSTRSTTKAYKPFSAVSKQMVQDVGNVELFELFETDPKTQCKECLSYWSEGIVDCTCGHLLNETVANRCFIKKKSFSKNSREHD